MFIWSIVIVDDPEEPTIGDISDAKDEDAFSILLLTILKNQLLEIFTRSYIYFYRFYIINSPIPIGFKFPSNWNSNTLISTICKSFIVFGAV
jgi:hypothetical protein